MSTATATRKPSPAAIAQAQAIERMEAIARRAEEAARAMEEATARNEATLSAIVGLARLLDSVSGRLPHLTGTITHQAPAPTPAPQTTQADDDHAPRNGRQLYAWARTHNLINAVEEIGEGRSFPRRMVDWSPSQVATAYADLFESEEEIGEEPEPEPSTHTGYGL